MLTTLLPQLPIARVFQSSYVMIGAHSVAPYPTVIGNPMSVRNCSTSWFRAAPPTTISYSFPPNASLTWLQIFALSFAPTTGVFNRALTGADETFGNTFFLIIFSIISGTAIIMQGLTSANA